MQFDLLTGSEDAHSFTPQPGVFEVPPQVGSLPRRLIDVDKASLVLALGKCDAVVRERPGADTHVPEEKWSAHRAE